MSSLMFWFAVINIASTALCLWSIYEAQQFLLNADEAQANTLRRINNILDQCLELEAKKDHDKRH